MAAMSGAWLRKKNENADATQQLTLAHPPKVNDWTSNASNAIGSPELTTQLTTASLQVSPSENNVAEAPGNARPFVVWTRATLPRPLCGSRRPRRQGDVVMIRIEVGREVGPGIFEYAIPSLQICGRSRQPLLDGCRSIKRAGGPTEEAGERAGVFRDGKTEPDISCQVLKGAELTVGEPNAGKIRFIKFREFDSSAFHANDAVT